MNQQTNNKLNFKYAKIKNHNLSHIVKKWQAFIDQKKEQNQIDKNIQNYLQCPISPPNFASPSKLKNPFSNFQGPHKEREVVGHKFRNQSKKKTLQIQDFDDSDIRNSAHSFEMIKNKEMTPQINLGITTPEKRSFHKLPKNNFCTKQKRHKSLPTQKNHNQTLSNNEYIKKILKKFQKHSSETKQQNCFSFIKTNQNPKFKKYNEAQSIKLFDSKTSIPVNKYKNYFSNKIKTRMQSNIKSLLGSQQKSKPKRSIQISPWQIKEDQS